MQENKNTLEKVDAGLDSWDDDDEVVEYEVRHPLKMVIPVRLPSEKWEALRAEAHAIGVGPTTLARMWILEKLRLSESGDPKAK